MKGSVQGSVPLTDIAHLQLTLRSDSNHNNKNNDSNDNNKNGDNNNNKISGKKDILDISDKRRDTPHTSGFENSSSSAKYDFGGIALVSYTDLISSLSSERTTDNNMYGTSNFKRFIFYIVSLSSLLYSSLLFSIPLLYW